MEGHCSTDQSPQRAVAPEVVEEEEEEEEEGEEKKKYELLLGGYHGNLMVSSLFILPSKFCTGILLTSEFNAAHANEFDVADVDTVGCYLVILSKKNWNVSTNLLKPIVLNSMKMRSTVSQVTTCGLTETEMTKLANTILRFLVATELQTEQKGRYEFVTF